MDGSSRTRRATIRKSRSPPWSSMADTAEVQPGRSSTTCCRNSSSSIRRRAASPPRRERARRRRLRARLPKASPRDRSPRAGTERASTMALDRRLVSHFDWTLFMMTLGLAGVGLLSVLSASWGGPRHALDPLVVRQLVWIGVGTTLMAAAAIFDYRALATYAYPLYVVTVGLLAAVMVAGHVTGGSRRWLNLGVLRLEPSEVAKLVLGLVMVRYLREGRPRGGWSFR